MDKKKMSTTFTIIDEMDTKMNHIYFVRIDTVNRKPTFQVTI